MLLLAYHSRRRRPGLLERLWNVITWPFRTVERIEASVVRSFRRRSERLRHKYRHSKVMAPLVGMLVSVLLVPIRAVRFVVTAPFRLIGSLLRGAKSIRKERQVMHLIQGLPAVLGATGAFSVLMMLTLAHDGLPQNYREQAHAAYDVGNYDRAQLYLQRVLQLGADTKETSYLLARTLEKTGQTDRARAILDGLAPDNARGYPEAHLWKAMHLLNDEETLQTEAGLRRLERHLLIAQEALAGDPDLEYYLGRCYLAMGDVKQALVHLKRASQTRPELHFDLAIIHRELIRIHSPLGDPAAIEQEMNLARPYYEQELKLRPGDEKARLCMAEIHASSGDYEEMFHLLREGITRNPDGPYQKALALGLIRYYDTLPRNADPAVRLVLLQQSLDEDPRCKPAFNRLLYFGDGGNPNQAALQAARNLLESLIAVGESAPLAHFALGIKAWQEQESDQALWHLERAYKLDPELVSLANNLAWVLAFDETSPDCERALSLINSVLKDHPDVPAYIETRGQILVKLNRWEEALDDLERALPEYRTNVQLHEALATVYEHLGQTTLAEKHSRVAANLRGGQTQ